MLLTVEESREHVTTTLSDDALRRLLDAAEEAIAERYGALVAEEIADRTDTFRAPGGKLLRLGRRASVIVSATEGMTILEDDDYELRAGGETLVRIADGTNSALRWRGPVEVVYTPVSDVAERCRVQLELVQHEITYSPGVASTSIGPWSESYSAGRPYAETREDILASLSPSFVGIR